MGQSFAGHAEQQDGASRLEAVGFGVVEVHGSGLAADVFGVDGDLSAEGAEAEAGDLAPLVGGAGLGDPLREGHAEVIGEGLGAGLIELADGEQAMSGVAVRAERNVDLGEGCRRGGRRWCSGRRLVSVTLSRASSSISMRKTWPRSTTGVAGHGEGELSLTGGRAFDGGDEEGADVEDGGDGGEPALVVVLER